METNMQQTGKEVEEREIIKTSGFKMLFVNLVGILAMIALFVISIIMFEVNKPVTHGQTAVIVVLVVISCIGFIAFCIMLGGFHIVQPKEALVLTLFGQYYGTIKKEGYYFVNPFCSAVNPSARKDSEPLLELVDDKVAVKTSQTAAASGNKKISLKVMTLNNQKQKVNDVLGNPIIIGAIVIWKVDDPTKAVFQVENYKSFLSIQCDSTIRNIARIYPYDAQEEDTDERSLRGSSQEVAEQMKKELQERVADAGLTILEVRITHLSYAEEIAAAMLQRQQAAAIIAARKKIVEGAVGMVELALDQLSEQQIVDLDEERKAQMVSNLLVVLCANKDTQPIVNSGSIY